MKADSITRIPVSPNLWALVDDADADEVKGYHWYAMTGRNGKLYVRALVWDGELRKEHCVILSRLIARPKSNHVVTHKNENPLDCRRENLLVVDRTYTTRHARKHLASASRFKGVHGISVKGRRTRWRASITVDGHTYALGLYETEEEAARVYDEAAARNFGEAARLNLPSWIGGTVPTSTREIVCPVCHAHVSTTNPRQAYCGKPRCTREYHRVWYQKRKQADAESGKQAGKKEVGSDIMNDAYAK